MTTICSPLHIQTFPNRANPLKPPSSTDVLSSKSPHHRHHPLPRAQSTPTHPSSSHSTTTSHDATPPPSPEDEVDGPLLALLRKRRTDLAFDAYSRSPRLPGPTCLSRLVAQLSYQSTPISLSRARSVVQRLRDEGELHRLDANSLGLLASRSASSGSPLYALSLLRRMLRSGHLPDVKAWSAVASRLSSSPDDGPVEALRLFSSVTKRVRSLEARTAAPVASAARPDTAAFNAALNACANLGDARAFARLFLEEMPQWDATPDVLTYNIVMKLCARAERRDLLAAVLERILREGISLCFTTLTSLVAAYVGLGELRTAEKVVQAMREGRLDLCGVLRESRFKPPPMDSLREEEQEVHLLLDKLADLRSNDPPLLPRAYAPDKRMYTTLMKGYMKAGRLEDVVRMMKAMWKEADPRSHPDEVTYTTVISALIKAGELERARGVLEEMNQAGIPANQVTYNVLLKGYCDQLQVGKAKELAREMAETKGLEPNVVSYNTLIDGCILVDDSAGALAYFNEMREKGIAPTKISYTTLMKAFTLAGQPRLAQKVFEEMSKDPRVKVDRAAWNMLVDGYCKLGLTGQPRLAQKVFEEMSKDPRVKVDRAAWNMLVDGYCKLGLVEEAKNAMEKMEEGGFQPDVGTYGSLANGIALARKPGEALLLWNEVKERYKSSPRFRPDGELLGALADVCVRAAFFRKALEIVACMEENGIAPNKAKYKRMYVELHSRMFTSKHASQARQDRRRERKRAAEAFKFWLGLPNSYYGSEWSLEPADGEG